MPGAQAKVAQATEYIILERRELLDEKEGKTVVAWVEDGTTANTARIDAVKAVAGDREGTWRPVPVRNWGEKPIRTRTKTETRTVTEEVDDDPAAPEPSF